MNSRKKTTLLCILDGFGYSEDKVGNAIAQANTPTWDDIWDNYPNTLIQTHGAHVGLPATQMGNSEVGHMNIGAGRVVYQDFTRISHSIETGSFFENQILIKPIQYAKDNKKALHVLGLLSSGGVHSHISHIKAMLRLAHQKGLKDVYLHAFLDGRDTAPKSAHIYINEITQMIDELGTGRLVSICGRYFAMDRDNRWDRVQKTYDLLVDAQAAYQADNAQEAIKAAYSRDESDEFVEPSTIGEPVAMQNGDAVVFMNFRSDRAREITEALVLDAFTGFSRKRMVSLAHFVTLTQYKEGYPVQVAYPNESIKNSIGEYISKIGLTQLRIAETEKYPHVTFFLNGGVEMKFHGEDRILVNSPNVATYDLKPEMSAYQVVDKLSAAIESGQYDVIICNFANADMVGHTGKLDAAISAIEALDDCLKKILRAIETTDSQMLISADHGNAEQMQDLKTGATITSHSTNLVPLVYVGSADISLKNSGSLCDLSPTILDLMGQKIPDEMKGQSLLVRQKLI